MLKYHLKTAWRNLLRNKTFSFIKIAGLSIGLAVCMLILLYIRDETSYDRFHEKQVQLFRIVQDMKIGQDAPRKMGITHSNLGPAFEKEIPEVSGYSRLTMSPVTIRNKTEVFIENPLFVDSTFLSVFSFPLLKGSPTTALDDLHSIILSEDFAKKYFGNIDAIGKTLELKFNGEFETFLVSAVAKNTPQNSTIRFDILLPYSFYLKNNKQDDDWIGGSVNTYLLLNPQANVKIVEQKMQTLFDKRTKGLIEMLKKEKGIAITVALGLEPIAGMHLGSFGQDNGLGAGSSISYSYILGMIAVFILIVACINFINLALAQSLKRSKEIGVKKIAGSSRTQLIGQFLTESLLVSTISFVIAIVLASLFLPLFNEMVNKKLSLSYLSDYTLYIAYFALLLITSFIAGFYPSLVLSSFQPVKVLYTRQKLMGKNHFSRGLIVMQLTLTVFLIIGTIAIYTQMNFLHHKDLGYDTEGLVRVDMPFGKTSHKSFKVYKNELAQNPSVINIAGRNRGSSTTGVKASGKDIVIDLNKIDENFFSALQIPMKEGRNFSPDFPSDATQSAIVNETFVKEAGWKDPLGRTLTFRKDNKMLTVVGVIKDYHFKSLKENLTPQLFTLDTAMNFGQAWVKIKTTDIPGTIAFLQQSFKKVSPFFPFSYQFVSDMTAKNYEKEANWKKVIGVSAILFIFISCIGLLGLVSLSIEQRTKEIGIRKVLGAAVSGIVVLISKDIVKLIGISFLIAVPAGYYAVDKWLQNFAYRIDISWWIFALAGAIVMIIVLITLSFRTIQAAITSPVKNLRTE